MIWVPFELKLIDNSGLIFKIHYKQKDIIGSLDNQSSWCLIIPGALIN